MDYLRLKYGWLGGLREFRVTSPFGYRIHPIKKKKVFHYGIDIAVKEGTEIKAPMNGKLESMGVSRTAGLWCTLTSGHIRLVFMHLSYCAVGEGAGASSSVQEGQVIARSGGKRNNRLSGDSTGEHLHFEYLWSDNGKWTKNNAVDPKLILSERLVGRLNNVFSEGVKIQIDKRTGKEIAPLEVGDKKSMSQVSVSDTEIAESWGQDVSNFVDDTASEGLSEDDVNRDTVTGAAKGIWQIIKLAMDSSVGSQLLYDTTISTQTGSIMGFINKACQQPLVEFSGDTFGDQYYFLVRRPPFDKELMLRALNNQHLLEVDISKIEAELKRLEKNSSHVLVSTEKNTLEERMNEWCSKYGYGIDYWNKVRDLEEKIKDSKEIQNEYISGANPYVIESKFIQNSSISFNSHNIYSWYQFYPQYEMAGDKMQYLVPAVLFPEYAAIWGSRALQIQSQYASFRGLETRDKQARELKDKISDMRCNSVLRDLKYLIESNAYNPFVRQGTLTLVGTRRIKRGMFIEVCIEPEVPEIFYVEGVSHNYNVQNNSVNSSTTLQLSHGMVKRYVKEANLRKGDASYFDIINFSGYEANKDSVNLGNWKEVISHWRVNKDIFNFFLKRQQFIKGRMGD